MPTEDLLTAEQKAAELGVSRSTLSRMVARSEVVPAYRGAAKNSVYLFRPAPTITKEDAA